MLSEVIPDCKTTESEKPDQESESFVKCEVTPYGELSRVDRKCGYVACMVKKIQRGEVIPDCDVIDEKKTPVEARGR